MADPKNPNVELNQYSVVKSEVDRRKRSCCTNDASRVVFSVFINAHYHIVLLTGNCNVAYIQSAFLFIYNWMKSISYRHAVTVHLGYRSATNAIAMKWSAYGLIKPGSIECGVQKGCTYGYFCRWSATPSFGYTSWDPRAQNAWEVESWVDVGKPLIPSLCLGPSYS